LKVFEVFWGGAVGAKDISSVAQNALKWMLAISAVGMRVKDAQQATILSNQEYPGPSKSIGKSLTLQFENVIRRPAATASSIVSLAAGEMTY